MINCPKCQVPNPDSATVCAACGASLAEQQFAQALGQAQQDGGGAAPNPGFGGGSFPGTLGAGAPSELIGAGPLLSAMDPNQAQHEINQYIAEQQSRKRTKMFINGAIGLVVLAVIGFFMFQSHRRKAKEEEVAKFYLAFREVDDGAVAGFWQCTVRAKARDVRLASSSDEVTDGLTKAFNNFPKGQPDLLRDKCIPMINGIVADLDKIQPPEGFAVPLDDYKNGLKEVKSVFEAYTARIEKRKQLAADEQEIRNAHRDFHSLFASGSQMASTTDTPNAMAYFNIMKCVIPDLVQQAKKLKRPPDSQPVVDLYYKCKDDPQFADKIRKECFAQRNETVMRNAAFKQVAQKMSGDDRDLNTLNYCFRKINEGFEKKELDDVARVFGKYRNEGRRKILDQIQKVKDQLVQ